MTAALMAFGMAEWTAVQSVYGTVALTAHSKVVWTAVWTAVQWVVEMVVNWAVYWAVYLAVYLAVERVAWKVVYWAGERVVC